MIIDCLRRGAPAEDLAWSRVQFGRDGVEVGVVPAGQVGALGEVLAQESVRVLVRAALPGAVRVGEEHRDPGLDGERGVRRSSLPRSQVSDRVSWAGSVDIEVDSALAIVTAP